MYCTQGWRLASARSLIQIRGREAKASISSTGEQCHGTTRGCPLEGQQATVQGLNTFLPGLPMLELTSENLD